MARRNKCTKGKIKEEDEATINNELKALNMLEEDMTVEDRRDLLKVVRMSESTAKFERRTRGTRRTPKVSEELTTDTELPASNDEEDKSSCTSSSKTGSESCTDSIEIIGAADQNIRSIRVERTIPVNDEVKPQSSPENMEVSTTSLKHDHLRDKKRNINPFYVDKESYRDCFKRKRGKSYLRFPYDLLSQGMDIDEFSVQFRKYSINHAKKIEKARNKRLNCVAWSKPIVGPAFTLPSRPNKDPLDADSVPSSQISQRYHFRGRQNKTNREDVDYIEDSDEDDEILHLPQKNLENRKRKPNLSSKNPNILSRLGNADEAMKKEKTIGSSQDRCLNEILRSPESKTNNEMSAFTEQKNSNKNKQQLQRESPPLVIVEEVNCTKKLYLQENLNQSNMQESEKTPKKLNTPTSLRTTGATASPVVSIQRIPLRRTNLQASTDDKNDGHVGASPVVIVEDLDEELHVSEDLSAGFCASVQSPGKSPNQSLSRSHISSPVVSLKRLPLRTERSNVSLATSDGRKFPVERSICGSESSTVPVENVTKRRRLDFQLSDDSVLEAEEDREHASECVQYVDEEEEKDRSHPLKAKRTRNK